MSRAYDDYRIDNEYERAYEVEVLVDTPTSTALARYGSGSGAVLKIYPFDAPPFLFTIPQRLNELQLLSWPDPLALVVMPSAFLISITDPGGSSGELSGFGGHSVHYIRRLHAPNAILLGHCCGIYCYDKHGFRWSHEDLFCCEDPEIEVSGDDVILMAHKHGLDGGERPAKKVISLATGASR